MMESKFIYKDGNYKLIHSKNNLQDNSFAESGQLGSEIDEKLKKLEIIITGSKYPLLVLSRISKVVITVLLVITALWMYSIIKNIRQTSTAKTMLSESNFDDIALFKGRDYFVCQGGEEMSGMTCQYFEKKELQESESKGLLQEESPEENDKDTEEQEGNSDNTEQELFEMEHESIPMSSEELSSQKLAEPVDSPIDSELEKYEEELNEMMKDDTTAQTQSNRTRDNMNEFESEDLFNENEELEMRLEQNRSRNRQPRRRDYPRRKDRRVNQVPFDDSEEDLVYRPRRARRMNNSMNGRMLEETESELQTEENTAQTEQSEPETKEEAAQADTQETKKQRDISSTLFVMGQKIFTANERIDNNNEGAFRLAFICIMSFFIGLRLIYWILNGCIENRITQLLEHFIYLENKSDSPVKITMNDSYNLVELTLGKFSDIIEDVSFEAKENQPGNKLNEIKNFNNKRVEESAEETNNKLKAYFNTNDESLGISISSDKNLVTEEQVN